MFSTQAASGVGSCARLAPWLALLGAMCFTPPAAAQFGGRSSVGGVSVDVEGMVSNVDGSALEALRRAREEALRMIDGDLAKPSKLRKVSLRRLAEAIDAAKKRDAKATLADEFNYLAGLQRIEYVFVYPDQKDIVVAGPADGWKLNDRAEVVGATSGLPVLRLDDLVVALQSAEQARQQGISCSIDPTAAGIQRLNAFLKKQKVFNAQVKAGVETSLGSQDITLIGVPAESRFAHVMLVADYRMKRYAMQLETPPVNGMPSYLELLRTARVKPAAELTPRWWIAADYKPLLTDGEGLAWQLRSGVKIMSEDEHRDAAGTVKGTGRTNPLAKKWADTMTAKYADLSAKETIFGELRNCMDLAVFAALVSKEGLAKLAGLDLAVYTDGKLLSADTLAAPKHVKTEVSLVKSGREWIITASGGVQFSSWDLAAKQEKSAAVTTVRGAAVAAVDRWWWD